MTKLKAGRTSASDADRILEWTYAVGPPRRSWTWFAAVLLIGVGIAGLLYVVAPEDIAWTRGMLVWTCVVLAYALAPSREIAAQLDGQLLYVGDVKRKRATVERNLNEFATWEVYTIPADRLNVAVRTVTLRPKDGRRPMELRLPDDNVLRELAITRISAVVPAAPDIAPTPLQRIDDWCQRLIGWR